MLRLARLTVERLAASGRPRPEAGPRTFTIVPQDPGVDAAGIVARLVDALGAWGRVELVRNERGRDHTSQWFHRVESQSDFVVYLAEPGESAWTRLCVQQADALLLLARAESEPAYFDAIAGVRGAMDRSELLLLHGRFFRAGRATAWRTLLPDVNVHHVGGPGDVPRIARMLTGRAVGLVLSGGGTRGFAHIGVIRALREHGLPNPSQPPAEAAEHPADPVALGHGQQRGNNRGTSSPQRPAADTGAGKRGPARLAGT